MSSFDDYDVLSNLGSNSCFYKVKNKSTAEICVWRAINVESFTDSQLKALLEAINVEKQFQHQNTVQVYSHLINDENKILYVIMKYYKYGNLKTVVQVCLKRNEFLSEVFLWRLLYNIVCILKLKNCHGLISLDNIFLDADYTIKICYLDIVARRSSIAKCVSSIGTVLYQLCTLQLESPKNNKQAAKIPNHYSDDFSNIITLLLNNSKKISFDQILCHPLVLLHSTNLQQVFMKSHIAEIPKCNCGFNTYKVQLEDLKNKEAALKWLEQKLMEKESILNKREEILIVMENSIKEKMRRTEMHLKKSRREESLGRGSNATKPKRNTYENLDTTLSAAECDESVILATSAKINVDAIKPCKFTRSLSERKIRFKGHSPLKEICHINRNNVNTESYASKMRTEQTADCILENVKSKKRMSFQKIIKRKSKLFESEIADKENDEPPLRPISWTEEAKRQAFDMLRVMNAAEVKHTQL